MAVVRWPPSWRWLTSESRWAWAAPTWGVETADVALAGDDRHRLLELRDLGRRSIGLIRQNYGMSIAVNVPGLLVSAGGALSPAVAAILHNASSVAAVGNSARMIRYQLGGRSR